MKASLKETLKDYIQQKGYVEYGEIVQVALEYGAKVSAAERRCRELCNEFPIEPIEKKSRRGSIYISGYKFLNSFPAQKEEQYGFEINDLISYLEKTKETDWIVDRVRMPDGKGCVMSHIFDFGGGDNRDSKGFTKGSIAWDFFEEVWATTYMIYPVNDGTDPRYKQSTPKQRVIAYLKDLAIGKEKNTRDHWNDYSKSTVVIAGKSVPVFTPKKEKKEVKHTSSLGI